MDETGVNIHRAPVKPSDTRPMFLKRHDKTGDLHIGGDSRQLLNPITLFNTTESTQIPLFEINNVVLLPSGGISLFKVNVTPPENIHIRPALRQKVGRAKPMSALHGMPPW